MKVRNNMFTDTNDLIADLRDLRVSMSARLTALYKLKNELLEIESNVNLMDTDDIIAISKYAWKRQAIEREIVNLLGFMEKINDSLKRTGN